MKEKNKLKMIQANIAKLSRMHINYSFPDWIRELRLTLGVSRQEMSSDLDANAISVFMWENGSFILPLKSKTLTKLSDYFGVKYDVLLKKCQQYTAAKREKRRGKD